MSERDWEVWEEEHVNYLVKMWGTPDKRGGRHWILIHRLATLIESGTLLDVGCGLGHLYGELKRGSKKIDYTGLDSSPAMIVRCKSHFTEDAERFDVGDIYDLSPQGMYDTVSCVDVLIHLPGSIEVPLQQLWGHTKKHLVLSVRTGNKTHMGKRRQKYNPEGKYTVVRIHTISDYLEMFGKLDNVGNIEIFHLDPRSTFFKITKGMKRPKARSYNEWQ